MARHARATPPAVYKYVPLRSAHPRHDIGYGCLQLTSTGLKEFAILTAVDDLLCRLLEAIALLAIGPRNVEYVKAYPNPAFFDVREGGVRRGTAQPCCSDQAQNTKAIQRSSYELAQKARRENHAGCLTLCCLLCTRGVRRRETGPRFQQLACVQQLYGRR